MAIYSVHLQGEGVSKAADAAFICEGFAWRAFFFGPLWLLQRRLWLAAVIWMAVFVAVLTVSRLWELSVVTTWTIALLLEIFFALEANRILEVEVERRGYRLVEIIAAPSLDLAEVAFFRHLELPEAGVVAPLEAQTAPPASASGADALAVSPESRGRR